MILLIILMVIATFAFVVFMERALRKIHIVSMLKLIDRAAMEWWARGWYAYLGGAYLNGYLGVMGGSPILPQETEELARLLDIYLLEKAIYELGYELGNRPAWAAIPPVVTP